MQDHADQQAPGHRSPTVDDPLREGLPGRELGGLATALIGTVAGASRTADPQAMLALQSAAGNHAATAVLQRAAAHPHIQRCGPGGCDGPDCDRASQGVVGGEREEVPEQPALLQRAAAVESPAQAVQRSATFAAGAVHAVNNLAGAVVNGTPAGVTWPTLNGTQFWSGAQARAAMVRPTLTVTAAARGGGFDAQVATVPANNASFDETVLSSGPWRHTTTKATIAGMLPGLAASCGGAGDTRFRAYGDPGDAEMQAANRRHEDHHATDHRAAFNATFVPWDLALTTAHTAGTTFHGATAAAAEAALWNAMGGTPDQVADAFFNACQAAVIAYHRSAAGGPIGAPTRPGSRRHCTISWAYYTNPS